MTYTGRMYNEGWLYTYFHDTLLYTYLHDTLLFPNVAVVNFIAIWFIHKLIGLPHSCWKWSCTPIFIVFWLTLSLLLYCSLFRDWQMAAVDGTVIIYSRSVTVDMRRSWHALGSLFRRINRLCRASFMRNYAFSSSRAMRETYISFWLIYWRWCFMIVKYLVFCNLRVSYKPTRGAERKFHIIGVIFYEPIL